MVDLPFHIKAKFVCGELEINDVYLEIHLPKNDNDEIVANCMPNNEQLQLLLGKYAFSIEGNAVDEFCIYNKIKVKEAIFQQMLPRKITKDEESYIVKFLLMDFYAAYERDNVQNNKEINGWFYVTLLGNLAPHKVLDCKPSGEVKVEPYVTNNFSLGESLIINLDTKYFYDSENRFKNQIATITYSKNVAEFSFQGAFEDIEKYSHHLDDFLMLMSFGIRKRTLCTGWIADNKNKFIKYLRRDIVIPEYIDENLLPNYLIEPNELKDFLLHSYQIFRTSDNQDILRRAIFPIPTDDKISTESYYLILFSCLESLLLYYKKAKDLESILAEEDFKIIKTYFKAHLKKSFIKPDATLFSSEQIDVLKKYSPFKRKMVYEKISELNRPSFSSILEKFCDDYELNLIDLWTLINKKGQVSLSHIRNKLIHGDTFKASQHKSLIIAQEHLRIIVERMILRILDWPLEKTRVSSEKLKNSYLFQENINEHMKILNS